MNSKYLHDLLAIDTAFDVPVKHLSLNSRQLQKGDVFIACQGLTHHGKQFIEMAVSAQVSAIIIEAPQATAYFYQGIPCIEVPDLSKNIGQLASNFYQNPSEKMQVIGVTGTNGKTSISHYIAQCFDRDCGFFGTLGYGVYGKLQAGQHTTPDAVQLQRLFFELQQQGIQQAVMEVSSHALDQHRCAGIAFDVAVLSNLSRDHLDYHKTMSTYANSKRRLFFDYPIHTAVINQDDAFGRDLLAELPQKIQRLSYSLEDPTADLFAHYKAIDQGYALNIQTPWGQTQIQTHLPALFNISNLLATLGALLATGLSLPRASQRLQTLQPASGRMETIITDKKVTVIIDYAHTPDALAQVLKSCQQQCQQRLWCVFGCGGDRDAGKRPLMGAVAEEYATDVVITNDNPRFESPENIIEQILTGLQLPDRAYCINDRATAITYALNHAVAGDWVVIAGKGHEDYQETRGKRVYFSDKDFIMMGESIKQND